MRRLFLLLATGGFLLALLPSIAPARTISFSGYTWEVRPDEASGGPGPNIWDANNVSVDANGWLHLRLTHGSDGWHCPEVFTQKRFGFGSYQFWVQGRVDQLDQNVVLGIFNYPTEDVGVDGEDEMDIEFSRWGKAAGPNVGFTVYPTHVALGQTNRSFHGHLTGPLSTQRFTWSRGNILFQSLNGLRNDDRDPVAVWNFHPPDAVRRIVQRPMPVHLNLWCVDGHGPTDGREVEVVIHQFHFEPGH